VPVASAVDPICAVEVHLQWYGRARSRARVSINSAWVCVWQWSCVMRLAAGADAVAELARLRKRS
jgi:hypothetical protein